MHGSAPFCYATGAIFQLRSALAARRSNFEQPELDSGNSEMEDVPAVGAQGAGANDFARRGLREVGHLACWSVTSAKPGNGVELLRDGRTDTYWQ